MCVVFACGYTQYNYTYAFCAEQEKKGTCLERFWKRHWRRSWAADVISHYGTLFNNVENQDQTKSYPWCIYERSQGVFSVNAQSSSHSSIVHACLFLWSYLIERDVFTVDPLYKRPAQAAFPIETPMTQYSRTFMVISLFHIAVMSSGPNMINMMRDTLPHSIVLTDSATHAQLLAL